MGNKPTIRGGVTWRSVIAGLLLIPINVYWVTVIEVRWYSLDGSCLPLFITPIFMLLLLVLGNLAIARRFPNLALNQGELLTTYIMVVTSSVMASHDMFQNLFGVIGHPYRFATQDNHWQELFIKYLPKWLLVTDQNTLAAYYQGGVSPYSKEILVHWIVPLAAWGLLMFVLIGMMLCMNIIIRKQWTQNEKLVFPLIQLPLAITEGGGNTKFFHNKIMWAGFALAFTIGAVNGLHYLLPAFPELTGIKRYMINQHLVNPPWKDIEPTAVSLYPFAIGIGFFIPLDLLFSCWFFYVCRHLFHVLGISRGWNAAENAGFPYFEEQSSGAWIALGLLIVWGSRKYLADVVRVALGREGSDADNSEAVAYRAAFIGIFVGAVFLAIFSNIIGMSAWVALVFFCLYFLLAISITRIRAEMGAPHEINFVNPERIMLSTFGIGAIGAANLSLMSLMFWFNRGYRSLPMANQLEAFKMAENTNIKRGHLVWVLVVSTVVGTLATYWANLHVTYHEGAMAKCLGFKEWIGREGFQWQLATWLNVQEGHIPGGLSKIFGNWLTVRLEYMIGGALVVMSLRSLRGAFIWWPLHPAGYALAFSNAMNFFWSAFFVSWLAKVLIVRYGGMRLHNAAVPFFMGLILGDFTIGSIWAILGPILGVQNYKIFI
ncbi:MAG: hypothetical protein Q7N50_15575 [Armatimonadota bacterium]|nr:hypothetical protein [Armatimonadota bacterium]